MKAQYVALLRGINVGGKNKLPMAEFKDALESKGFDDVITYLNTGNILLRSSLKRNEQRNEIESIIQSNFGLQIPVLLKTSKEIITITDALPDSWVNDKEQKSDVFFLWPEVDSPEIIEQIKPKATDTCIYTPGAILFSVARQNASKSAMVKLPSTKLYQQVTIRNVNTTRAIKALINEQESA